MILIFFPKKRKFLGGFGDRIVGIISCRLIAKNLNQKFYIKWNKENIVKYIKYDNFKQKLNEIKDKKFYNLIDKKKKLKNYLENSNNLFPNKLNIFLLNQEISQFLYKNKQFCNNNFYNDILKEYKNLFTRILVPKKLILDKVNNIIKNHDNIVGIQIRTGDKFILKKYNENEYIFNFNELKKKLIKIKRHLKINKINNYKIFITSDFHDIYKISSSVWNKEKILFNNDYLIHLDKNRNNINDLSKIFVDCYLLSQKTSYLYISFNSNYGRISGLSSKHNNIYCNKKLIKLNKKSLLSKTGVKC